MSFKENGLDISILPPGGEKIVPGRNSKTRVIIRNELHKQGIRLEVSLDLQPQLQSWCKNPSHSITILYQQSQEIEFSWSIPLQATPGNYNYYLRIKLLRSRSFYAFTPKRRQLTILVPPKVKPQINNIEPSFAITPASNSTQPIPLSPGIPLNLEIDVHNCSNRTDNFYVTTDLEDSWYRITYPETIKKIGAIEGTKALNLNPGKEGKIYLSIQPPADTVAGNYKPEIKLHSLNYPELFLKKIIYLHIPPQNILQAELQTILNKVSYKKGQYKIILTNQGNTFRAIELKAKTSDEDEGCEYFLEQSSVRIAPNKNVEVKLEVQPKSKQKRPLLTTKQFNFQVDLIDKNDRPLPKNLPLKSSLFWRSRPLWQLLLLFVLALGIIGSVALIIWELLKTEQPKITLKPEKTEYIYKPKESVNLAVNWTVENYKSIDKIVIFDKDRPEDRINTKCYYFDAQNPRENCTLISQNNLSNNCIKNNKIVSCSNVIFYHAQDIKNYTFVVQAFTKKGKTIEKEIKEPIAILPRPTLEVFETLKISPVKSRYKPKEPIKLIFEVSDIEEHFAEEDKILLLINDERQQAPIISQQNIYEFCSKSIRDRYSCTINIPNLKDGKHTLAIELQYDSQGRLDKKPERYKISEAIIVQTPIRFEYFTVNGSSNTQIEVEPNTPIIVRWSVTGTEVKTNISCIPENIRSSGRKSIQVLPGRSTSCILTASDVHNNSINPKEITVFVKSLPQPEPELPPPPPVIIQDPF